ncbi:MAG TPA: hypothetical protein VN107_03925 [Microbacterium sp.]|nr:hypothetical protein [Microbacterium sp.]
MPESPRPRATPHDVIQRRLMIATGVVIVMLIAAIGLVGSLTVQTLTAHSTDTASVSTAPGPPLPDVDVVHRPGRSLLIIAV